MTANDYIGDPLHILITSEKWQENITILDDVKGHFKTNRDATINIPTFLSLFL